MLEWEWKAENRRGKSMEGWKKGGRMYGEKNTEKKILLFRCRSLNPRGKKLKEWRKREETEKFSPPVNVCTLECRNSFVSSNFTLTE